MIVKDQNCTPHNLLIAQELEGFAMKVTAWMEQCANRVIWISLDSLLNQYVADRHAGRVEGGGVW